MLISSLSDYTYINSITQGTGWSSTINIDLSQYKELYVLVEEAGTNKNCYSITVRKQFLTSNRGFRIYGNISGSVGVVGTIAYKNDSSVYAWTSSSAHTLYLYAR